MQTFLPYADFRRCAAALDPQRLGKQRVETLQILRALHFPGYGWRAHPAVLMWRGWTPALVAYGLAVVEAWTARGRPDTTGPRIAAFDVGGPRSQRALAGEGLLPPWLGRRALHRSHRSALVRKDPVFYRPRFPGVPADLPYVWPEPGPEQELAPITGWVVRGRAGAGSVELDRHALGGPRRSAEAERRFLIEVAAGMPLAVPCPEGLRVGQAIGEAVREAATLARPVRWRGRLDPAALRFPAALQNPQPVFPLRGEDTVLAGA